MVREREVFFLNRKGPIKTSLPPVYDCVTPPPLRHLHQASTTTGALDLGGASTQISFVSDSFNGSESPSNSVLFRLYGSDYSLYTHSFLCYGKDQALKMVLARQIQVSGSLAPSFSPSG